MISNLGYLVIEVKDLNIWAKFAIETIGLNIGQVTDESINLRMDELESRVFLKSGHADDLIAVGWEFEDESKLITYIAQLSKQGVKTVEADTELLAKRYVEKMFMLTDETGLRHEFYFCAARAQKNDGFTSKKITQGFKTGRLGVGHFVVADDMSGKLTDFYKNVLGLKVSDICQGPLAPDVTMEATFFHTQTGRHHSVATAKVPFQFPKRIHHIMFEVNNLLDVGLAYERCKAADLPFEMHLGSHPNDEMFSFYVKSPSGFALEIGYGAIVVDDETWSVKRYKELSAWGHKKEAH
ncbi:VOC family protein [Acinetobacter lactucae]|uniref:VOC family protein n=1 Tax=Acinetobacter lactucae TaxID=1785128 RepID=UPI0021CDC351|nr:VOC family protein [Acinetobacter lactucae]MCU4347717.1 VOC family protein [Acinetobacter lactucae]